MDTYMAYIPIWHIWHICHIGIYAIYAIYVLCGYIYICGYICYMCYVHPHSTYMAYMPYMCYVDAHIWHICASATMASDGVGRMVTFVAFWVLNWVNMVTGCRTGEVCYMDTYMAYRYIYLCAIWMRPAMVWDGW